MNQLNLDDVRDFVNEAIGIFHQNRLKSLESLNVEALIKKKNPYLYYAKNIRRAQDLVVSLLEAHLSSSEEKLFGDFLEELAIFVASQTTGGRKSAATGIDLEFTQNDTLYLISVKSGPNWGNSSQQNKQETDFKTAVKVLKQSQRTLNVQPVLGICYGKTKTSFLRGYMKVVGQNFWYLISENPNLYIEIIEPVGYRAKEHTEQFEHQKDRLINILTAEISNTFCQDGYIDWERLVAFNSGNLDLLD